jgi:hypothetical protein
VDNISIESGQIAIIKDSIQADRERLQHLLEDTHRQS